MRGFIVITFCSVVLALPHGPDRYEGRGGRPGAIVVVGQPQPRPNTIIVEPQRGGLLNGLGGLVSGVGSALGSILVEDSALEPESS